MLTRCWRTKHTKRRNYYVTSSPHTDTDTHTDPPHDADLDADAVYDTNVDADAKRDAEEPNIAPSYVLLLDADAKTESDVYEIPIFSWFWLWNPLSFFFFDPDNF